MWVLGAWGKPLLCPLLLSVPVLTPDGMAEMSSGVLMTASAAPPPIFPFGSVSLLSQVVSPTPSAFSLHVAEGPGLPQVLCLSNKVETKPECQATFFCLASEGGHGGCASATTMEEHSLSMEWCPHMGPLGYCPDHCHHRHPTPHSTPHPHSLVGFHSSAFVP